MKRTILKPTVICLAIFAATISIWIAFENQEKPTSAPVSGPETTVKEELAEPEQSLGQTEPARQHFFQNLTLPEATAEQLDKYYSAGGQFSSDNRNTLSKLISEHAETELGLAFTLELAELEWRHGFFAQSVATLKEAWEQGQKLNSSQGENLAERALALYLRKLGQLGAKEELRLLVDSLVNRPLGGSASEALIRAKSALWFHENQAEENVFCGFTAANTVCLPQGYRPIYPDVHDPAEEKEFIQNGLSLFELRAHSHERGGDLEIYRRVDENAPIPVPSVVHWNFDHYSAATEISEGKIRVHDAHLKVDSFMDPEAFEDQFSGYLLVTTQTKLPSGYEKISDQEAKTVFGSHCKHGTDDEGDEHNTCSGSGTPMAEYSFRLLNPGLEVFDTPISYSPPIGPPVAFRMEYDQRSTVIEDAPTYGNFGSRWTHSYSSFIELTGTPVGDVPATSANIIWGNGQFYSYNFNTTSSEYVARYNERPRLSWSQTNSKFTFNNPDGSQLIYGQPNSPAPTRYFLTSIVDPQGNALSLTYDGSNRLTSITDTIGQQTTLSYTPASGASVPGDAAKIRSITDPFGRSASFTYSTTGQLLSITDPVNIVSSFTYETATDFINALTTPYGTTNFEWGDLPGINDEPGRWIQATNPQGDKERAEANDLANFPANGSSLLPAPTAVTVDDEVVNFLPKTTNLHYRNTYYWDRQQMRYGEGDYSKATIYNWTATDNIVTSVLASFKSPLESRVWFNYPGQVSAEGGGTSGQASKTVRAVEDKDGVVQWTMDQTEYHAVSGKVTRTVDPLGRELIFEYNDDASDTGAVEGIDLTAIKVRTSDAVDGFETLATFSGYSNHLPTTSTNAAGQSTTFAYNARGQVTSITDPNSGVTAYSYDTNGYLQSIDGPLAGTGDTLSFTYDLVGRTRTITDFDGYTVTYSYDDIDRLTRIDYPDSTYEENSYTHLDLVTTRDRLGRLTTFTYDEIRQLTGVTDSENRTVGYEWCRCGDLRKLIDPMGRVTHWKRDVQGRVEYKEYVDGSRIRFAYEEQSGRLAQRIDEKSQLTRFRYNTDGTLHSKIYPNAEHATATVTYSYDDFYQRVTSMNDGIGETSTTYHPVGSLGANEVATIDGPWNNDLISYTYDSLGRVSNRSINGVSQTPTYDAASRLTSLTNPLGIFTYSYDGVTSRLSEVSHGGGVKAQFSYYGNTQDNRLQTITNRTPSNTVVSKFDYNYDAIGRITQWTQQSGSSAASAEVWALGYDNADQLTSANIATGGSPTKSYGWTYDPAANRLTETEDTTTETFRYNALNQLDSSTINLPETTYEWDAEDRLIAINQGTDRSEFEYDGLGHRVRIREISNDTEISNQTYLWCGLEICEERDALGDTVQQHYFAQGMQDVSGASPEIRLYTFDHLGSIRELLSTGGSLQERLSYDAWGNVTRSTIQPLSQFSYTGHFTHKNSELHLAPYRAYNPKKARWISRDPIGESGPDGSNVYFYVRNNPLSFYDGEGSFAQAVGGIVFGAALDIGLQLFSNGGRLRCLNFKQVAASAALGAVGGGLLSKIGKIKSIANKNAIGFAENATGYALGNISRIDHASRHLISSGLIKANPGSKVARETFKDLAHGILTNPTNTFSHVMARGGQSVKGFLGQSGGKNVIIYVAKESKGKIRAGDIVTSFVPSAQQLRNLGL